MRLQRIDFNDPVLFYRACLLVPVFFGLVSVWLGADTNWDLLNYHAYNAFSLLHGKLNIDLAPASMPSYFNPLLDVPYYLMTIYLPGPLVGFIMGTVHGLSFVLLAGIARKALPGLPEEDRYRIPLMLASFGCLTGNYLSGLGNSMGDDTTSLFVLASVLVVLANWSQLTTNGIRAAFILLLAGVCAGFGAGLKLTNAVFAVALCAGFCVAPGGWAPRIRMAFLFGIGVLLGIALASGYWFYEMWRTFGNPLFPQFSNFFPNSLTSPIQVSDIRWRPKSWTETALWPFIFSFNPLRVGELKLYQIIWAVAYTVFWGWLLAVVFRLKGRNASSGVPPTAKYVMVAVVVGYLVWMKLFSIQRYLVAIEMCLPLMIFVLLGQLLPYLKARKISIRILAITSAVVLLGGVSAWGHTSWTQKMYRVNLPKLDDPARTTVLLVGGDPPFGWLVTQFPPSVAFVQVAGSFPEAMPAFAERIHEIQEQRGGPTFALLKAEMPNWRPKQIANVSEKLFGLGVTSSDRGCQALRWAGAKLKLPAVVTAQDPMIKEAKCGLAARPSDIRDVEAENRADAKLAEKTLSRYGYTLDAATCNAHSAYIGDKEAPFQWCAISRIP
ncbi:MAG: hypothetical protein JWP38_1942 [Herbaspirillum sp.]|nr:hypothetical protein [Herbaspirillum sp.]